MIPRTREAIEARDATRGEGQSVVSALISMVCERFMITPQRFEEIARFLITGVVGVSVEVLLTVLLTECFGLNYLVSLALAAMVAILVGFLLNRSWTFRKRGRAFVAEFCRYVLVTAANIAIGLTACGFLVEEVRIPYVYAIAIVAATFAPLNYLVHRAWTFGLSWLRES